MKAISFWIIFVLFLVNFSLAKCNISNNSLIFVVELFSPWYFNKIFSYFKGARANSWNKIVPPSNWSDYKNDELTPIGERQHFILGTTLRERYITN